MGDRGHVYVEPGDGTPGVWFYAHWAGSSLPGTVADALDRGRERWTDDQYLARIIFCEMVQPEVLGTTGYGIGARPGDNGDGGRVVRVNVAERTVTLEQGDGERRPFPFEQFVRERPAWDDAAWDEDDA